jgi:hypothetical protein
VPTSDPSSEADGALTGSQQAAINRTLANAPWSDVEYAIADMEQALICLLVASTHDADRWHTRADELPWDEFSVPDDVAEAMSPRSHRSACGSRPSGPVRSCSAAVKGRGWSGCVRAPTTAAPLTSRFPRIAQRWTRSTKLRSQRAGPTTARPACEISSRTTTPPTSATGRKQHRGRLPNGIGQRAGSALLVHQPPFRSRRASVWSQRDPRAVGSSHESTIRGRAHRPSSIPDWPQPPSQNVWAERAPGGKIVTNLPEGRRPTPGQASRARL